jgi:hypothetical protein
VEFPQHERVRVHQLKAARLDFTVSEIVCGDVCYQAKAKPDEIIPNDRFSNRALGSSSFFLSLTA